jgi:hypothetical protein
MALHHIDPHGLTDDALMTALRAMESALSRTPDGHCHERYGDRERAYCESGKALAAEAWDRGLISTPTVPQADQATDGPA